MPIKHYCAWICRYAVSSIRSSYFYYCNSNRKKEKIEEKQEEDLLRLHPNYQKHTQSLCRSPRHCCFAVFFLLLIWIVAIIGLSFIEASLPHNRNQNKNNDTILTMMMFNNNNFNNNGNPASSTTPQGSSSNNNNSIVRIQPGPDPGLDAIASIDDIHNKITEIRHDILQQASRDASSSSSGGATGMMIEDVSDLDVDLYERKWIPTTTLFDEKEEDNNDKDNANSFSFLQFNILAQGLSVGPDIETPFEPIIQLSSDDYFGGFTDLYPSPDLVLDYELRKWRIIEVLVQDSFDIIALEEIDQYYGFYEPLLSKMDYDGYFVPKPKSPCVSFGWYSDGCALFWKSNKFKLLYRSDHKYQVGNQIYTIATLRHLPTNVDIIVAATHLKAGKASSNEQIRNLQMQEVLQALEKHQQQAINTSSSSTTQRSSPPIIFAGDFNSDPSESGSCIQRILQTNEGTDDSDASSSTSTLSLKSAYPLPDDGSSKRNTAADDDDDGDGSSPITRTTSTYTTWKKRGDTTSKRIIDFIFHNGHREKKQTTKKKDSTTTTRSDLPFQCTHVLEIPNDKLVETNHLLPSLKYPSDHLAIGAKFKLL